MQHPARRLFRSLIRRPDQQVPLAEAAVTIAWEDQGGADPRPRLAQLDQLARAAHPAVAAAADPPAKIAALNRVLFLQAGFHGDPHYSAHPEPANSYLDRVLERRSGLPILLAIVYLEVGWRLGLPLDGLALPGHFIVRWPHPDGDLFIDPFSRGALWSQADCDRQIASFYGRLSPELTDMIMRPAGRGAILARLLRNLKQTHLARGDLARALAAVERLFLLDQSDSGELRDRGLLRFRLGRTYQALADLEEYARRSPAADDLSQIRGFARELIEKVIRAN